MVEEALGVDRRAIKVFSKTIESLRHRVCTSFGMSDKSYGGRGFSLVGTGQGNILLGAICRDQSCLIFKIMENRKLGAKIFLLLSNRKVYRMEIAFVDDTDMYLNGKLSAKNI